MLTLWDTHYTQNVGNNSQKLDIPNPTVKRILTSLVNQCLIEKFGIGAGTNYVIK